MAAVAAGDIDIPTACSSMNQMICQSYGGERIECWLSAEEAPGRDGDLSARGGSYLDYPLTASCARAIREVIERDRDLLFP